MIADKSIMKQKDNDIMKVEDFDNEKASRHGESMISQNTITNFVDRKHKKNLDFDDIDNLPDDSSPALNNEITKMQKSSNNFERSITGDVTGGITKTSNLSKTATGNTLGNTMYEESKADF